MNEQNKQVNHQQIPLHRRIAEALSQQVVSGELKPGEKFPSERKIASQFQSSRATVRTALQHLEQAGLITRRDRRSAVVAIRRDIAPQLRLACSSSRLINLFSKLHDTQVLPPRCQLQQFDMQQPGSVGQFALQPAVASDMLICELEYVSCFNDESDEPKRFPNWLLSDSLLSEAARSLCGSNNVYLTVPITLSPMVVYYNKAIINEKQAEVPRPDHDWNHWLGILQYLTEGGRYGFQFRPTFDQVSAIMNSHHCSFFEKNGYANVHDPHFESTIRFMHDLLHGRRIAPLLARADLINLFAERRCALALDGGDMLQFYYERLGDDLGVTMLPNSGPGRNTITGLAAIVLNERKTLQPVQDLLRALTSLNTQRLLTQYGMGMPVRIELHEDENLGTVLPSNEYAQSFTQMLNQPQIPNLPACTEHKLKVEALLLEMWLNLDHIDSICHRFRSLN